MAEPVFLGPIESSVHLMGIAILMVGCVMLATRNFCFRLPTRISLLIITVGVAVVPVCGLGIAAYLRGFLGDVSITTLVLILLSIASQLSNRNLLPPRELIAVLLFVSAAGLFLYPLSTGISGYDAYSLGYGSQIFFLVLLLITVLAVHRGHFVLVLCITISLLAYRAGLYESRNLWDLLVDPLVTLFALLRLVLLATGPSKVRCPNLLRR